MAPGRISNDALIHDLKRVAEEMGRPPTNPQYADRGQYGASTIGIRFDGWDNALEAAGLDPNEKRRTLRSDESDMSRGEMLDELRAMADILGRTPKYREVMEHPELSPRMYDHEFGSFNNAVKEAKLPIGTPRQECRAIPKSDFVASVKRLGEELGHAPSASEYQQYGDISFTVGRKWWDEWGEMLADIGLIERADA